MAESNADKMIRYIKKRYDLFPAGDDDRVYARLKTGGRAELLGGGFVMRATEAMKLSGATVTANATEAAKRMSWLYERNEPKTIAIRSHHKPGRVVLDLAQRGNAKCVVVTADGWTVEDNPPDDVIFRASGRPLPEPKRGGSIDELRELLHWEKTHPHWLLVKGWVVACVLADIPRPLLGFFGPKGSTKTTTGWFVVSVFEPKSRDPFTLGSGFGKERSDDESKALNNYLVSWDNVSSMSEDGADFLCRLVTGESIEKRKLYSDTDTVTINYRRSGVVTGVTVPRGLKTDSMDRLMPMFTEAPKVRMTEQELLAAWDKAHPRILAGALDLVVTMLKRIGEAPTSDNRMADYCAALWAVDPELEKAFIRNYDHSEGDMAAEDPLVQSILKYVKQQGGIVEGGADELRKAMKAEMVDLSDQWWPKNATAFAKKLTENVSLLKAVGIEFSEGRDHTGKKWKKLRLDFL